MALIVRPNTYTNNTAAVATQVNDDFDTIYDEFNGAINSANIATSGVATANIAANAVTTAKIADANVTTAKLLDAAVTPAKILAGTGTTWVWQSWTPTFANWAIGAGGSAGTTAKYTQVGKTVFFYIVSTLGTSGQSVGTSATFSLPVTAASGQQGLPIGDGYAFDNGGSNYDSSVWLNSTTTGLLLFKAAGGTYTTLAGTTSTVPISWAAGDSILYKGFYEAA